MSYIADNGAPALMRMALALKLQYPVWDADAEVAICAKRDFKSLGNAMRDIYSAFEDIYWSSLITRGFVGVEPGHVSDPVILRGLLQSKSPIDPVATLCAIMVCTPNNERMRKDLKALASLYQKLPPTAAICPPNTATRHDTRAWCSAAALDWRCISVRDRSFLRLIAAAVKRAENKHGASRRAHMIARIMLEIMNKK